MSELRIYVRHIRAAKLCTNGARPWFEEHNLDWNAFLRDGISADTIRQLDDGISNRALAAAEAEAATGQAAVLERRPAAELRAILRERQNLESYDGR